MKKIIVVLLALVLMTCCFACNKNETDEKNITVAVPDGAPSLAVAKLISENKQFEGYNITYNIVAGATNIRASVLNGEADIAVLPSNIAANLYNSGVDIKVVSGNVFGVLYMVGEQAETLFDLKGKVVVNIGQGGTPDILFKYILRQNNIPYVEQDTPVDGSVALSYVNDGPSLIQYFIAKKASFGILGEPAASQAVQKTATTDKPLSVIFDLQAEWKKLSGYDGYAQAVTVVKGDLLKNDGDFVKAFLEEEEANLTWLGENLSAADKALKDKGGKSTFTATILPKCNLRFVKSADLKEGLNVYLKTLYDFSPKSIGGKLPDDGFYLL